MDVVQKSTAAMCLCPPCKLIGQMSMQLIGQIGQKYFHLGAKDAEDDTYCRHNILSSVCLFISRRCLFELPVPASMLRISGYALVLGNA